MSVVINERTHTFDDIFEEKKVKKSFYTHFYSQHIASMYTYSIQRTIIVAVAVQYGQHPLI